MDNNMNKNMVDFGIKEYENLKNESLRKRNFLDYAIAICELGIPEEQIEDVDLFQMGMAEIQFLKNKKKEISELEESLISIYFEKNNDKKEHYKKFYCAGHDLYKKDSAEAIVKKRKLLSDFFPNRFGDKNGKTPASKLPTYSLNVTFDSIIEFSIKKYHFD